MLLLLAPLSLFCHPLQSGLLNPEVSGGCVCREEAVLEALLYTSGIGETVVGGGPRRGAQCGVLAGEGAGSSSLDPRPSHPEVPTLGVNMTRLSWCFSCVIQWSKYLFSCFLPLRFCLRRQPEDLEAPKSHHFKVKTFKKVKPCGICRQVITREGCTCKVSDYSLD
ncbi:hypothetical protein CB1_000931026 [Camelus ferus]|nr:hypothetical protein CB1_000931026 [Camelus ferus]